MSEKSHLSIDPRLQNDCHVIGTLPSGLLLLHKNATLPWLILVPTEAPCELHELDQSTYRSVMDDVARLGRYVTARFQVDKINTAAIGNIVRQLHIHVIGRRENDPCWPGVVWGQLEQSSEYSTQQIQEIRLWAASDLQLTADGRPPR